MKTSSEEQFRRALALFRAGNLDDAEVLFKQVLQIDPRNLAALNMLGILLTQRGRYSDAEGYLRAALNGSVSDATLYNHALVLQALKRPAEALEQLTQALAINRNVPETWNNRGTVLNDLKRYAEALHDFDAAIALKPDYAETLLNKGNSLTELGRHDDALATYERALAIKSDLAEAWSGRGSALVNLGRSDEALAAYERALAVKPQLAEGWMGRGNALFNLGRNDEALVAYERAVAIKVELAEVWLGRGNALFGLGRHDEALAAYEQALAIKPELAEAWVGRGNVLVKLSRSEDALLAFDKASAIKPNLAEAWVGRANVFVIFGRPEDALLAYDKAAAIRPDLAEAWVGRGNVLFKLGRSEEALLAYEKAAAIKPDLKFLAGMRLHAKSQLCDWRDYERECEQLITKLRAGRPVSRPFEFLAIGSSSQDHFTCAQTYVREEIPVPDEPLWKGKRPAHDRLRLAYLSADFRHHAVAMLIAQLFELHDRSKFEVFGVSVGADDGSEMRARLVSAFDQFLDVRTRSDREIAHAIKDVRTDILIDLTGYTRDPRSGVLAYRPAPLQVNYLGYPATLGMDCVDYIIADPIILPFDQQRFFSERIVQLPDCYQVNDTKREIAAATPTRREVGLPEQGVVFACFNNSFKITPEVFTIWMRALAAVEGSVLWLLRDNDAAAANLRKEAMKRGIDPARLIFAGRMPTPAHLARHRLADLFLDTLPYNAHTTASDALWAGLPVLTCRGETFAGRVAASLLNAVGLPELVTENLADYEALARKLAHKPSLLADVKAKLARNRKTCPLFDTARFTRHIEAAYTQMWETWQRGETPKNFAVAPLESPIGSDKH